MNNKVIIGIALLAGGLVFMATKKKSDAPASAGTQTGGTGNTAGNTAPSGAFKQGDEVVFDGKYTGTVVSVEPDGRVKISLKITSLFKQTITVKASQLKHR